MAKSAARQVTNQIVRGCWGVCWGEKKVSQARFVLPDATLARLIMPTPLQYIEFNYFSGMNEAHFANNNKGAFAPLFVHSVTIFSLTATG
ncbi:hypothetical protein [Escherichia coli]|uniref:hypothetical protein n=1 Tax=Escherichia coli TaxID=562 RepID=UPI001C6E4E5E|nr:hypothetical protein [Escherichia coli]